MKKTLIEIEGKKVCFKSVAFNDKGEIVSCLNYEGKTAIYLLSKVLDVSEKELKKIIKFINESL